MATERKLDVLQRVISNQDHPEDADDLIDVREAFAELIEWQRLAIPLMKAAASWMPSRKCANHIREIDALLARVGGSHA